MTYEITLISAEIHSPLLGKMRLGLKQGGARAAEVEYQWDDKQFAAIFHGHAPSMPAPAHPTVFIERAIAAINKMKTENHRLPSDVFTDNRIYMSTEPKE